MQWFRTGIVLLNHELNCMHINFVKINSTDKNAIVPLVVCACRAAEPCCIFAGMAQTWIIHVGSSKLGLPAARWGSWSCPEITTDLQATEKGRSQDLACGGAAAAPGGVLLINNKINFNFNKIKLLI